MRKESQQGGKQQQRTGMAAGILLLGWVPKNIARG